MEELECLESLEYTRENDDRTENSWDNLNLPRA